MDNSPEEIVIAKAVPADAEAIVDVQSKTWLDTYPNEEAGITLEDIRLRVEGKHGERIPLKIERWRKAIESNESTRATFVARVDDKVVGFAAPGVIDGQKRIGALYVLPEFQGYGLGGKLMREALAWYGDTADVYLRVATYNHNAINFYKRFGFEITETYVVDEGDTKGTVQIPEIEMVLRATK